MAADTPSCSLQDAGQEGRSSIHVDLGSTPNLPRVDSGRSPHRPHLHPHIDPGRSRMDPTSSPFIDPQADPRPTPHPPRSPSQIDPTSTPDRPPSPPRICRRSTPSRPQMAPTSTSKAAPARPRIAPMYMFAGLTTSVLAAYRRAAQVVLAALFMAMPPHLLQGVRELGPLEEIRCGRAPPDDSDQPHLARSIGGVRPGGRLRRRSSRRTRRTLMAPRMARKRLHHQRTTAPVHPACRLRAHPSGPGPARHRHDTEPHWHHRRRTIRMCFWCVAMPSRGMPSHRKRSSPPPPRSLVGARRSIYFLLSSARFAILGVRPLASIIPWLAAPLVAAPTPGTRRAT